MKKVLFVVRVIALLCVVATVEAAAPRYGFGKIVELGKADELIIIKSLQVLTADTVAFVYYFRGNKMPGSADNAASYKVTEDGKAIGGLRVLGKRVKFWHMGHVPDAYSPVTSEGIVYVRLAKPMARGKEYTFSSTGVGGSNVNVSFAWSEKTVHSEAIKANQIGYLPDSGIKLAYFGKWMGTAGALKTPVTDFSIIDLKTGTTAYSGKAKLRHRAGQKTEGAYKQDFSGENVYGLDFSSFKKPGVYCISIPGVGRSYSFRMDAAVMAEPLFTTIRCLYHQRCGTTLDRKYTPWVRGNCRQHVKIGIYPEYGPALNFKAIEKFINRSKAGGTLKYKRVRGSYHDAADFDRRPEHIGIANTLADAYEMNPKAFIDNQFIIPESGNGIPDIIDEAVYALLYYFSTQWPDGGISAGSEGTGHPHTTAGNAWMSNVENEAVEYVMLPVSQYSCFSYAASAAHVGRLLMKFTSGKAKGAALIKSAARAFDCAINKWPPSGVGQEQHAAMAAMHLLYATREKKYGDILNKLPLMSSLKLDWLNNANFAWTYCSLSSNLPGVDAAKQKQVKGAASGGIPWAINAFTKKKGYLHYKNPWAPMSMGTHSTGQLSQLVYAWKLTGDKALYDVLCASADVALGANPMGQVQCSGLGQKHVVHPEHLVSMNDKLVEYLPGIWTYGPGKLNPGYWLLKNNPPTPPAGSFPPLYSHFDIDQWPGLSEFTVFETIAPGVLAFGVLAPENPKPYLGPLPRPK